MEIEETRKLAEEFSNISPNLSGYIEEDRKTLEHHKDLLDRARKLRWEISENDAELESIVQGTVNMANSYLGLGRSEYSELREGAIQVVEFLGHLLSYSYKTQKAPIVCALEFLSGHFERRRDIDGLSTVQKIAECEINWIRQVKIGSHYHSRAYDTKSKDKKIKEEARQELAEIEKRYEKFQDLCYNVGEKIRRIKEDTKTSANVRCGSGKFLDDDTLGKKNFVKDTKKTDGKKDEGKSTQPGTNGVVII